MRLGQTEKPAVVQEHSIIRRMRKTLTLTILLVSCCGVSTFAQKAPRPTGPISAAEILDKYVAATGGLEAWRALRTVDAHGSFSVPPSNSLGDFDFYYKLPASDAFHFFVNEGLTSVGHNEGTPFSSRDLMPVLGINWVTVDALEEDWLALTESEFEQHYTRIELQGLATVDGKWAYALLFTPKVGDRQRRYYDSQSFLLVRMDSAQRIRARKDGPEHAYEVETYFSDYRNFGGIKFPERIEATSPAGGLVLVVNRLHINHPVNDSIFGKK
jgi:hypothetical protein